MKKRTILKRMAAIGLAAVMVTGALGCGGTQTETNTELTGTQESIASQTQEGKSGSEATLRFSWWGGEDRHEATLAVIDQYMQENPGITIEGEYSGWDGYLEKLTTQLAAGTAPDIIQIDYAFLENFWKTDDFVDFNSVDTVDMSGFSENLLEGVTSPDGRLIGVPSGLNFTCLFANQAAADKYGVDLTQHFGWDTLLEVGKQVHAQDESAYLIYPYAVNRYFFEPYLFNLTGKKLVEDDYTLGFDRESLVKTYEYIDSLYEEGVMQPYDEVVEITSSTENPLWLNDQIVLIPDFSSSYDSLKASLDEGDLVCLEPLGDNDAENTGIVFRPTNLIAVNANSEHVEEALEFVNYFFNDDQAIETLGLSRSVPATQKAMDAMVANGKLDEGLKSSADYAQEHKGGLGLNVISTNAEIETIENDALSALYYDELTPETAADEFMELMTEKVAELKESLGA